MTMQMFQEETQELPMVRNMTARVCQVQRQEVANGVMQMRQMYNTRLPTRRSVRKWLCDVALP